MILLGLCLNSYEVTLTIVGLWFNICKVTLYIYNIYDEFLKGYALHNAGIHIGLGRTLTICVILSNKYYLKIVQNS